MNVLFVGGPLHGSRVELGALPLVVRHVDGFVYCKSHATTSMAKRPAQWVYRPENMQPREVLQLMKELGE